jgi:hypothetical protein
MYQLTTPEEGVVFLPFKLQFVNSAPVIVEGDCFTNPGYPSTGKFTMSLREKIGICYGGHAWVSVTADNVDLHCQVDSDSVVSGGTVTVKCKTGTANADPPANAFIGGFLMVRKVKRHARRH